MATLPIPTSTVLETEQALTRLYRDRLAALHTEVTPGSSEEIEVVAIDASFEADGYTDHLADRVERVAGRVERARRESFDYIMQTEEGALLRSRAVDRLEVAEQEIRTLGEDLAAAVDGAERLVLGRAIRARLTEHREAFRSAVAMGSDEDVERLRGPGELLLSVVDANLHKIEAEEGSPEAQTTSELPGSGLRSIDLGRLAARTRSGERASALTRETSPHTLVTAEAERDPALNPGAITAGGWGDIDPGLTEVLRARIGGAAAPEADRTPETAQLKQLDVSLSEAARNFGASYAVREALSTVQATRSASSEDALAVAELAMMRANLYAQRLALSSHVKGGNRARMEARHAELSRDAERLKSIAEAGRPIDAAELKALRQGLRADARALSAASSRMPADAVADLASAATSAASRVASLERAGVGSGVDGLGASLGEADAQLAADRAVVSRVAEGGADGVDINASALEGARSEGQARFEAIATDRLFGRQNTESYSSVLPAFAASRVFVQEDTAVSPMGFDDAGDRRAYARSAGLASTANAGRLAHGVEVGPSLSTQIQGKLQDQVAFPHRADSPAYHDLAQMGNAVARSLSSLSGMFESGMRSTLPLRAPEARSSAAGVLPRMAANMPSRIFADTSSRRMQQSYLPALARVAGFSTPSASVRAALTPSDGATGGSIEELASPEALFFGLLGDMGRRLEEEEPHIAKRLQGQLRGLADMIPRTGQAAVGVLSKYSDQMRQRVQGWLGGGDANAVEAGDHAPHQTGTGGALRSIGEHIGGMFARDRVGIGGPFGDTVNESAAQVEDALRREGQSFGTSAIRRLEGMLNKGLGGMEAFSGPTAGAIAQEMGAQAFTVGRKMFFGENFNPNTAIGRGLLAHEMVHAASDDNSASHSNIAAEEQQAYGVQSIVEQSNASTFEDQIQQAFQRMELAKEQNSPPPRLPDDPGGTHATANPDPAERGQNPTAHNAKEEQIYEAILERVIELVRDEQELEQERSGRF